MVHIPVDIRRSSEADNFLVAAGTVLGRQYLGHEGRDCRMGSWNSLPVAEVVVGHRQRNSFEDSPPVPSLFQKFQHFEYSLYSLLELPSLYTDSL